MAKTDTTRKPRTRKKRLQKTQNKYRLIIFNDESFAEIISFRLTKMNVFILFGFISVFMVTLVYLLIALTPLKEYVIPDYPKIEERQKILANVIKVDSLEYQLKLYDQKMQILSTIMNGGEPPQYLNKMSDSASNYNDVTFSRSVEDSLLRLEIQEYEALNVSFQPGTYTNPKYLNLYFYAPIHGTVTNGFSEKNNHFATDIVAPKNTIIYSVLPGVVVFDTWTIETGYTIMIQHSNDFISVYKHNSKLLKKMGDRVEAGEGIAIIGNSGELSTGPHLHFELWHESKPVDSEDYIVY